MDLYNARGGDCDMKRVVTLVKEEDLVEFLRFLENFPGLQKIAIETTTEERTKLTPLDPDEFPYYWGEVGC